MRLSANSRKKRHPHKMQTDPELEALLSLLDDDDEKTLLTVMSSLLRRHTDLLPHLAELQESASPQVRKKIKNN